MNARWLPIFIVYSAAGADAGKDALSVIEKRCLACHGVAKMSGLDLRSRPSMLSGGKRGAAAIPGKAEESLLIRAVARTGELQMPPGNQPLAEKEVAILRQWIADGAPWNVQQAVDSTWWSFRSPIRPAIPAGANNPVDAFLDAALRAQKLKPAPRAGKLELIRRATFDLHGLPPSPEEVDAFLLDSSPEAWEKVVDRLLGSNRYGERWGRHWLDVVRYADTGGFETDIYFPNAWRYRDYVIQSYNDDKPYDRFVQEQVAGDELWPDNLDLTGTYDIPKEKLEHLQARIGTALYTFGPVEHEAALNGEKLRYEWRADAVDTTTAAFLGLTMGCARCHDHKFDPLSQRDYYRLQAIFSGSEQREIPVTHMMNVFGYYTGYPSLIAVDQLRSAVNRLDQTGRKRAIDELKKRFQPEVVAAYEIPADKRTDRQKQAAFELDAAAKKIGDEEIQRRLTAEERQERQRLLVQIGETYLRAPGRPQVATVLGHADLIPEVHVAIRGDFAAKGEHVTPGFPAALGGSDISEPAGSIPQRRRALALWLTQPDHPLTARVMVNRIWQGHFGRGIAGTPNDFGRQGEPPTHPELLDWLATEFVARGWKMKPLHRLILLSGAYQRSSSFVDEDSARIDASNRFLWRGNRRRVEAEALRDSVLAVSGALNSKFGGPPVVPHLTPEEMEGIWRVEQWPVSSDPEDHHRRSVYFYVKRSFRYPMFETFDQPDTSVSCARRDSTTVAPQALALLNSRFMQEQAARFAGSLEGSDKVGLAWRRALGRGPSAEERARADAFLTKDPAAGLIQLCLVLFNMNEFLYVD